VVGLKDSKRSNAMARAKSTATPTYYFVPKFKAGDLCKIKYSKNNPEIKGLTVEILRGAEVHQDQFGRHWVGYETDLQYRGAIICAHENTLVKIGGRE
jgi:hypothetical protein